MLGIVESANLEKVWERTRRGRHTAILGALPSELPSSCGFYAIRVSGESPHPGQGGGALRPLLEARYQVDQLLGGPPPLSSGGHDAGGVWGTLGVGPRRRLFDDVPEALPGAAVIESLNRLSQATRPRDRATGGAAGQGERGRWALIIDAVDRADEDTLHLLREIVSRPSWLTLPLLLCFTTAELPPGSPAALLLAAVTAIDGPDGLVEVGAPVAVGGKGGTAGSAPGSRATLPAQLRRLSAPALAVLRAGALIGSGFEATLVAALLETTPVEVLELLQQVADAGVDIEDNGDGRFDLPEDCAQALRASTLPSLAITWHRRLAELLSHQMFSEATSEIVPPDLTAPLGGALSTSAGSAGSGAPSSTSGGGSSGSYAPVASGTGSGTVPPAAASGAVMASGQSTPGSGPMTVGAAADSGSPSRRGVNLPSTESTPESSGDGFAAIPLTEPNGSLADVFPPRDPAAPRVQSAPESHSDRQADTTRPYAINVSGLAPSAVPSSVNPSGTGPVAIPTPGTTHPAHAGLATTLPPVPGASSATATGTGLREGSAGNASPAAGGGSFGLGADARAAGHLVAAGEVESGAARFLSAAREAAAVGAHVQAVQYAREAIALIDSLPVAPRRRRLRIIALCELGRLQWQSTASVGARFTLAQALETLQTARAQVEADDPTDIRTSLASLLASVYYDIGDLASLEKALGELTGTSRALMVAGDAMGAARLLNDQAAIYLRIGDAVRASHLLEESRRLFERLAGNDLSAEIELAETEHLLARLPLHVAARPGREGDAIELGFRHARAAEATYRRLGATRELTRVWETLGRLSLRKGGAHVAEAQRSLLLALEAQRELGDVLGLARTTAALSETLSARGDYPGAAMLLGESISLNLEKGSPIGLAFNRRGLDHLMRVLSAERNVPPSFSEVMAELRQRLLAAEQILGRVKLPSDQD